MKKNYKDKPEETRQKSGRFNFVDLFVIVLFTCCIVLVCVVYAPEFFKLNKSDTVDITYVVEFEGVRPDYASFINVGDKVTTDKGYEMGAVSAGVEIENYNIIRFDPNTGDVVASAHPSLSNLLVTVKVSADSDSVNGFSVSGKRIAVGAEMNLVFPGFTGKGVCISITENGNMQGGDR